MEKKIEEKGGKKEEEVGDFFFQAEDGIRDRDVTGVQTCALPIFIYKIAISAAKLQQKIELSSMLCQNSFFFFVKSLLYGNFAVVNQVSCLKTYI